MNQKYNVIIQFQSKPIQVFSGFNFEEAIAMVETNKDDMISCQIERVK